MAYLAFLVRLANDTGLDEVDRFYAERQLHICLGLDVAV